jgi:hypothetical protein
MMNLKVLKKTRHAPQPGDIFVMQPDDHFLFGRVINTQANPLGVGGGILVYIYSTRSHSKLPPPNISPTQLLVPPLITNRQPWSKGYFEHVGNQPLGTEDVLKQHCFVDTRGWFFDHMGSRLREQHHPVGQWGLHSYRTIDDDISKALNIPLAAD